MDPELATQEVAKRNPNSKEPPWAKPRRLFLVFTACGLTVARRPLPFTFVHGNESDKAGKHDSIRCGRVNVDIR
jgi:hypothetical protein